MPLIVRRRTIDPFRVHIFILSAYLNSDLSFNTLVSYLTLCEYNEKASYLQGVLVLKISITSHSCAKIYLSSEDMHRLGLSLQDLKFFSDSTALFISGIAAFLTELGLIDLSGSQPEYSVSEVFDGVVAEISASQESRTEETTALFVFTHPQELIDFCGRFPERLLDKVRRCELYRFISGYRLVLEASCSKSFLLSHSQLQRAEFDEVCLEKTREYGKLLSRTPIETIRDLKNA